MSVHDFIESEINTWGYDYIDSLFAKGYSPKLTTEGWRWFGPLTQPGPYATIDDARVNALDSRSRHSVA